MGQSSDCTFFAPPGDPTVVCFSTTQWKKNFPRLILRCTSELSSWIINPNFTGSRWAFDKFLQKCEHNLFRDLSNANVYTVVAPPSDLMIVHVITKMFKRKYHLHHPSMFRWFFVLKSWPAAWRLPVGCLATACKSCVHNFSMNVHLCIEGWA